MSVKVPTIRLVSAPIMLNREKYIIDEDGNKKNITLHQAQIPSRVTILFKPQLEKWVCKKIARHDSPLAIKAIIQANKQEVNLITELLLCYLSGLDQVTNEHLQETYAKIINEESIDVAELRRRAKQYLLDKSDSNFQKKIR